MASTTFVRDALYRVSVQLHDISPQFTRWTQRELVSFLNDAQRAIAKYIPSSCARVDAFKLQPGTKQSVELILAANIVPGDGSAAADVHGTFVQSVIRNMGVNGITPGRAIRIVDREILDSNSPDWHTQPASPVAAYVFDPRYPKVFYVSPGVPSAGGPFYVEASLLANPTLVPEGGSYLMDGSDTTPISVDDKYLDDIVDFILARAYMKDAEFAADTPNAQLHTARFVGSINAQSVALGGVNPNLKSLPMSPNVPKRQEG